MIHSNLEIGIITEGAVVWGLGLPCDPLIQASCEQCSQLLEKVIEVETERE